jgi:hypothetical protein
VLVQAAAHEGLHVLAHAVLDALGVLLVLPRATTAGLGDDNYNKDREQHAAHGESVQRDLAVIGTTAALAPIAGGSDTFNGRMVSGTDDVPDMAPHTPGGSGHTGGAVAPLVTRAALSAP